MSRPEADRRKQGHRRRATDRRAAAAKPPIRRARPVLTSCRGGRWHGAGLSIGASAKRRPRHQAPLMAEIIFNQLMLLARGAVAWRRVIFTDDVDGLACRRLGLARAKNKRILRYIRVGRRAHRLDDATLPDAACDV